MKKRLTALVLALCLCLTWLPMTAAAEDTGMEGLELTVTAERNAADNGYDLTYTATLTMPEEYAKTVDFNREDSMKLKDLVFQCRLQDDVATAALQLSDAEFAARTNLTFSGEGAANYEQTYFDLVSYREPSTGIMTGYLIIEYKLKDTVIDSWADHLPAGQVATELMKPMTMIGTCSVLDTELDLEGKSIITDGDVSIQTASGGNIPGTNQSSIGVAYDDHALRAGAAVTGVTLNKDTTALYVEETEKLIATVLPADAGNKSVRWASSNGSVASVDSNGVVTAHAPGRTTITVITVDGNYMDTCEVTVSNVPAASVVLNKNATTLRVEEQETLTATVLPPNAANKNVVWSSSDNSIAKVDSNGVVTAMGVGTATITVTTVDGNHTATCVVTVEPVRVSGVTLNKSTTTVKAGSTEALIATVLPANATNKDVVWTSSNDSVASVNSDGVVTAKVPGTTTITVTTIDGSHTATCIVTVEPVNVTGVSLNKNETGLKVGNTEQLIADILPENATNKNVTWSSSDSSVATVNSSGIVTAVAPGTATITVTTADGSFTDTCVVTVGTVSAASVSLNKSTTTLLDGSTETLIATVLPADAANKNVIWSSSDDSIASVDANGVVTAEAPGTVTITATTADGGHTATCVVTVEAVRVTGVTLNKSTATLNVNGVENLSAVVLPGNATNPSVTWSSSNSSIASVDSNGVVTAHASGTVTITVTTADGGYTATCVVTVTAGGGVVEDPIPVDPEINGVSDLLITDDHMAFMEGYPDGNFKPEKSITRAEVAMIFYRLLRNKNVVITTTFSDVSADKWYAEAVNTLASMGIVNGVGEGRFNPERAIKRSEFATIAARFADAVEAKSSFVDVPKDHWAYQYISIAAHYGWVEGVGEGRFAPDRAIKRSEAATLVNHMLGRLGDENKIASGHGRQFPDVPNTYWGHVEIAEATTGHDHKFNSGRTEETWH